MLEYKPSANHVLILLVIEQNAETVLLQKVHLIVDVDLRITVIPVRLVPTNVVHFSQDFLLIVVELDPT